MASDQRSNTAWASTTRNETGVGITTGPAVPDNPVLDVHRIVQTVCTVPPKRPSGRNVDVRWYVWLHSERVPGHTQGVPGPGHDTGGEPSPGTSCSVTGVATSVSTTLPTEMTRTTGRQLAEVTQNHVSTPTRVRTRWAGGAKNGTGGGSDSADSIPLVAVPTLPVWNLTLWLVAPETMTAASAEAGCDARPIPATSNAAIMNFMMFRTGTRSCLGAGGANDFLAATQPGGGHRHIGGRAPDRLAEGGDLGHRHPDLFGVEVDTHPPNGQHLERPGVVLATFVVHRIAPTHRGPCD